MFSASRSALVGAIAAITILLYKLTGTKAKFMKVATSIVLLAAVTLPIWEVHSTLLCKNTKAMLLRAARTRHAKICGVPALWNLKAVRL